MSVFLSTKDIVEPVVESLPVTNAALFITILTLMQEMLDEAPFPSHMN